VIRLFSCALIMSGLLVADASAAAPDSGVAFFGGSSNHDATVLLDGREVGTIAKLKYGDPVPRVDVAAAPGVHTLGYRLGDKAPAELELTVRAGEIAVVGMSGRAPSLLGRVEAGPAPGPGAEAKLTIVSHEGDLRVAVNGEKGVIKVPKAKGDVPARVTTTLPAGIVLLGSSFASGPWGSRDAAVRLEPGQETVLRLDPFHVERLDAAAAKLTRIEVARWTPSVVLVVDGVNTGLLPEAKGERSYPPAVFQARPGTLAVGVNGSFQKLSDATLDAAAGERLVIAIDGGTLKVERREAPAASPAPVLDAPPKRPLLRRPTRPVKGRELRR